MSIFKEKKKGLFGDGLDWTGLTLKGFAKHIGLVWGWTGPDPT